MTAQKPNAAQQKAYNVLRRIYRKQFEESPLKWRELQERYNNNFGPDEKAARMISYLSGEIEMRRPVSPTVRALCKGLGIPSQGRNRRALFEFLNEYQKIQA